ncbi:hypothetical protein, partial [Streptomyces sp. DSM 41029]
MDETTGEVTERTPGAYQRLLSDPGFYGRADHARVVDEAGAAEWVESLAEVMAAKAKARKAERAEWDRL